MTSVLFTHAVRILRKERATRGATKCMAAARHGQRKQSAIARATAAESAAIVPPALAASAVHTAAA